MAEIGAIQLTGGKELQRELEKLEKKAGEKLLKKATRLGGNVFLKAIRKETPVGESGMLRKQTKLSVKVLRKVGYVSALIKPKKAPTGQNPSKYQHLVTGGTSEHEIAGRVAFDGEVFARVRHRGAKSNRYVDRAFDRSVRPANDVLFKYIQKEIILNET